jgi:transcriptional regulator with XRE-family HTH domain
MSLPTSVKPTAENLAPPTVFGAQLRTWRSTRGQSQMALALAAGVSTRHLSFLETGRASPSREMVLSLSLALELPLRSRNQLLMAAGFAPMYSETPMDAPAMGPVRDAIEFMLGANEPNPTFVINRRYDVLEANRSGHWLMATFSADITQMPRPLNMAQMILRPAGLRPSLREPEAVSRKVLARLQRDLGGAQARDARDEALLQEIAPMLAQLTASSPASSAANAHMPSAGTEPLPLMVGLQLQRDDLGLSFFTTIATLGTTLDVTLQELRIETLFPADAATKAFMAARAGAS